MMAAYPNVPLILQSVERRRDPVLLSTALNGAPKIRRLYDRPRRSFNLVHRGLTDAQKKTIDDFYDANRMTTMQVTWPCVGGVVYSLLEETGEWEWSKDDGKWSTQIPVIEA
jgi:hypothetical protein